MPSPLAGPGQLLPLATNLYPSYLTNAPIDCPQNRITLAGGQALPLPAGDWYVDIGSYSFLQFYDPVSLTWRMTDSARGSLHFCKSDGFNLRLANMTGCPVAAIVVAGGSNYVQASTTVTPSTGNSTWQAIVGGMLSVVTVSAAGAGYGIAPQVFIPAPPAPGVQATAYAAITNGTVSGVTLSNVGAGYTASPTPVIVPNPADPNINSITQASVVINLNTSSTLAGAISAVLCTNPGAPTTTLPTLTVTGAGASASVNAVTISTLLACTVGGVGAGYANPSELSSLGGQPVGAPAYTNPSIQLTGYRPRKASAALVTGAASLTITSMGTVYDGGLFAGLPTAVISTTGVASTAATLTLAVGTTIDTVVLQPAP